MRGKCTKAVGYDTEAAAWADLVAIALRVPLPSTGRPYTDVRRHADRDHARVPVSAYRCTFDTCGKWHLTSMYQPA